MNQRIRLTTNHSQTLRNDSLSSDVEIASPCNNDENYINDDDGNEHK